jgi:hypothetical protein
MTHNDLPAKWSLPAKDPRATIAAARHEIVELRKRYQGIRLVPSIEQAQRDVERVKRAIATIAPPDLAGAMVGTLLKGWDRPPGADARDQLAIYLAVVFDEDTEEESSTCGELKFYSERAPGRFSTEVIAFAIMELWRTHKFKPAPCELLGACKHQLARMKRLAGQIEDLIKRTEEEPARIERDKAATAALHERKQRRERGLAELGDRPWK